MKRKNPKTGKPFKTGDCRSDGFKFWRYRHDIDKEGYFVEHWCSPRVFEKLINSTGQHIAKKDHLKIYLNSARKRAKNKNLPFNLDFDYLVSIASQKCPVFDTAFVWGQRGPVRPESPSLDRIIPNQGYVKGNVMFISHLANSMKQNATPQQLQQFARWIRKNEIEKNDETK